MMQSLRGRLHGSSTSKSRMAAGASIIPSCLTATYVEHPESQAVMTSWALLALLDSVGPRDDSVRRGIAWLCRSQRADGSWPDGAVNGVFFGSAMLSYRLYPLYFPLWALNRYLACSSDG